MAADSVGHLNQHLANWSAYVMYEAISFGRDRNGVCTFPSPGICSRESNTDAFPRHGMHKSNMLGDLGLMVHVSLRSANISTATAIRLGCDRRTTALPVR